jgi:hypothetical protein
MRAECIQAVESAVGRAITVSEARGIEQRIRDAMAMIAKEDPQTWHAMPEADRLKMAAKRAAEELIAEAAKKKQRLQLMVQAHDGIEAYIADRSAKNRELATDTFSRLIAARTDSRNGVISAEDSAKGINAVALGRLTDAFDAASPRLLGLLADRTAESELVRALHGDKNARPEIAKAVQAWVEVTDSLRERYNAAGGTIGKMDNWGMPHSWDQALASSLGKQQFVDDLFSLVDRSRYVHEDGRLYSDDEMKAFLAEAWTTIVKNRANKPIAKGSGVKANRHSQHRQLHFRDAEATLQALEKYSGKSVLEAMVGHVRQLSRDIAIIETFGPNADHTVSFFLDKIRRELTKASPEKEEAVNKSIRYIEHLYDNVAGNVSPPPNRKLADAFGIVRSVITGSRLGSAAITSISDEGTLYLTAAVNNIPAHKVFLNEIAALNPADQVEKNLARRAGLLAHTMTNELDRFGTETMGSDIPAKITSAVMRASGLNAITEVRRRAFSVAMMDTIGSLTRRVKSVDDLDPADWRILRDKGITQEEWDIWRAAELDKGRGDDTILTPESIYRLDGVDPIAKEKAATKLLSVVLSEQDIAVIEPGARERTLMQAGAERGTWKGELVRSFFQFKSFPIAMMYRHWGRALKMYDRMPQKVGYLTALIGMQTALGALAMQTNEVLSGKNPRNMNPMEEFGARNWLAALLKGGSLGLYGDFLFAEASRYGQTFLGAVGGPMVGLVEDSYKLTMGNIQQSMRGEEADAGAEFVRFIRSNTPGSSLWYTKAAVDRMTTHQLMEYMNPGYLQRMQRKAYRDRGETYWWEPGQPIPDQAPEFETAIGD